MFFSWSWICSHRTIALSAARPLNVNLSICPWNCWLSWHTQPLNISAPHWERKNWLYTGHPHREGWRRRRGWVEVGGSGSTGQTVSERRRGSVTYCFTGTLPDLLGVKARSSLVYTQPWISAWNMSTSSQPISHRGGAVWAADTSRFPWTMRPIPHARPLSVTGGVETDTDRGTLLLHWATELSPSLGSIMLGPASDSGSLFKRWWTLSAKLYWSNSKIYHFGSTSWIIICVFFMFYFPTVTVHLQFLFKCDFLTNNARCIPEVYLLVLNSEMVKKTFS